LEAGSAFETRVVPLAGAAACVALAAGIRARWATLVLVLAWAVGFINDTLSVQQTKFFPWLMLLVQVAVPPRADLQWRMPERVYRAAWIVTALFYTPGGFSGLGVAGRGISLELVYAPMALIGPLRPWLWTTMLLTHLVRTLAVDQAADNLGRAVAHLFTFDPA
jgi:hypothetical protein